MHVHDMHLTPYHSVTAHTQHVRYATTPRPVGQTVWQHHPSIKPQPWEKNTIVTKQQIKVQEVDATTPLSPCKSSRCHDAQCAPLVRPCLEALCYTPSCEQAVTAAQGVPGSLPCAGSSVTVVAESCAMPCYQHHRPSTPMQEAPCCP